MSADTGNCGRTPPCSRASHGAHQRARSADHRRRHNDRAGTSSCHLAADCGQLRQRSGRLESLSQRSRPGHGAIQCCRADAGPGRAAASVRHVALNEAGFLDRVRASVRLASSSHSALNRAALQRVEKGTGLAKSAARDSGPISENGAGKAGKSPAAIAEVSGFQALKKAGLEIDSKPAGMWRCGQDCCNPSPRSNSREQGSFQGVARLWLDSSEQKGLESEIGRGDFPR